MIGISKEYLGPKAKMTINLIRGLILAVFVVLNQVYFNLNGYVFLALFIGLFIAMELILRFMKKIFYW
ncbi:MAG: hypothetical protein ACRC6T_12860 [Sarcina sp.]